jgi:hypothetical protein
MTGKEWTREMYIKLEKMVKKKASPGEMAVALKVDKAILPYRLHLLKTQTSIQTWTEEELDLLEHSKNLDAYIRGCIDLFGKHRDKNIFIAHWMGREKYLAQWFKEKEERKKAHTIVIAHKQITEPRKADPKKEQLPEVGEQLAILIDRMSENTAVMKELLQLQNTSFKIICDMSDQRGRQVLNLQELVLGILEMQTSTYTLFKGKLEQAKVQTK